VQVLVLVRLRLVLMVVMVTSAVFGLDVLVVLILQGQLVLVVVVVFVVVALLGLVILVRVGRFRTVGVVVLVRVVVAHGVDEGDPRLGHFGHFALRATFLFFDGQCHPGNEDGDGHQFPQHHRCVQFTTCDAIVRPETIISALRRFNPVSIVNNDKYE